MYNFIIDQQEHFGIIKIVSETYIKCEKFFINRITKLKRKGGDQMVKDVEEYVSRIRSKYSVMSESEKKIADYILSNRCV